MRCSPLAFFLLGGALSLIACAGDRDKAPPLSPTSSETRPAQALPNLDTTAPSFSAQITASPFAASGHSLEEFPLRLLISSIIPKDGIPALSNPSFATDASFLNDDDLVLGVVINGLAKAYPHNIGWWHEIVNDRVGGHPISVTFCPLTGTGLVFDAQAKDGSHFELGVSGLLFNTNLVMYDRRDGRTLYPQLYFTSVQGPRRGESLTLLPVIETRWSTWKRLHPDTQVVAYGTYAPSQYTRYPYGAYRTDNAYLIFGISPILEKNPNPVANHFGAKDRVLGLRFNGQAKAYPFDQMGKHQIINDQVGGVDLVILWDRDTHLALPFSRKVGGQTLNFDIDQSAGFPFQLVDRETKTRWNANGIAVAGPLAETKQRLTQVPAHNSMWFAWVTFWQDTEVWTP